MNIFVNWWHGDVRDKAFRRLLKELHVRYCGYLAGESSEPYVLDDTQMVGLFASEPLTFYREEAKKMPPLDGEILEKMHPYEPTAMAILNRWRRSLVNKGSYAELHEAYLVFLRYCNGYLKTNSIELLIQYSPPHVPVSYMFYALCRVHNIPTVCEYVLPEFLPEYCNKFLMMSIEDKDRTFLQRLETNLAQVNASEEDVVLSPQVEALFNNYTQDNKAVKRAIEIPYRFGIQTYIERIAIYLKQKRYITLLKKAFYEGDKKRQKRVLTAYEEKKAVLPIYDRPFLFFPLHFQPEASTLPCGGVFVDQLVVIQMICACLPKGTVLFVKEHPAFWLNKIDPNGMGEGRSKAFYDEICALPNVRLIRHDVSSLDLIDHCTALITVTGTTGVEALFKQKPVLVFGNQFYTEFPGVFHIKTMEQCQDAIRRISDGITMPSIRELRACFKALEPDVIEDPSDYVKQNTSKPEYKKMVDECADKAVTVLLRFLKDNYRIGVHK